MMSSLLVPALAFLDVVALRTPPPLAGCAFFPLFFEGFCRGWEEVNLVKTVKGMNRTVTTNATCPKDFYSPTMRGSPHCPNCPGW